MSGNVHAFTNEMKNIYQIYKELRIIYVAYEEGKHCYMEKDNIKDHVCIYYIIIVSFI